MTMHEIKTTIRDKIRNNELTKVSDIKDAVYDLFKENRNEYNWSYDDYIKMNLKAVDVSAVEICKKENIKMIVFDADNLDNIDSVVSGDSIGTTIGG